MGKKKTERRGPHLNNWKILQKLGKKKKQRGKILHKLELAEMVFFPL